MPRKHEIELYTFAELEPKAKEKASEDLRKKAYENQMYLDELTRLFNDEIANLNLEKSLNVFGGSDGVGFSGTLHADDILQMTLSSFESPTSKGLQDVATSGKNLQDTIMEYPGLDVHISCKPSRNSSYTNVDVEVDFGFGDVDFGFGDVDVSEGEQDSVHKKIENAATEFIENLERAFRYFAESFDLDFETAWYWADFCDANNTEFYADGRIANY